MVEFEKVAPARAGLSAERLESLCAGLERRSTKALVVLRGGRLVCEWYGEGFGPEKKHYTASLAKALVGGLSLMLALEDGLLGVDEAACQYIAAWRDDPVRRKMSIRHLATHCSGIADANQEGVAHEDLPDWMGDFWRRKPDPFRIARDRAPVLFEPGAQYAYSNPGMAMLAYAVTAALQKGEHGDIRTLLRERLMRPLGVGDEQWSCGYGRTYEVEGLPLVANWGGGSYAPRAVARVGQLMLQQGQWQGRSLLAGTWVERAVAWAGTPLPARTSENPAPGSGLCWWTNFDRVWPQVPADAYAGAGAGNQILLVVPSLELVAVRNGDKLGESPWGADFWGGVLQYFFNPLMEAVES